MAMTEQSSSTTPLWAWIGTVVFVIVVPGTFAIVAPLAIAGWRFHPPLLGIAALRIVGVAMIVAGAPLFFRFLERFVRQGHGTPAPIAPPQHLVVTGPFRYVRNPGYIAVVCIVIGEALLLGSGGVLAYVGMLAIGFHLFVVLYEEPDLRRRFGAEYEQYCRDVPRWLPRLGDRAGRPPQR
jgi:protein-S-isoprenylcysteine O-methyltransferase Ste14